MRLVLFNDLSNLCNMAVFGAVKVEIDLIYLKLLEAIWLQKCDSRFKSSYSTIPFMPSKLSITLI